MELECLSIKVNETIKSVDAFGNRTMSKTMTKENLEKLNTQLKGTGGTLHITRVEQLDFIPKIAWDLSLKNGLPTVVVVKPLEIQNKT